jgi:hypothetical protein
MRGAILPLPKTPSRRGVELKKKHWDNFTFTFTPKGVTRMSRESEL